MNADSYNLSDDTLATFAGPCTAEDMHRVALFACSMATDVDDARELLDALGLLP